MFVDDATLIHAGETYSIKREELQSIVHHDVNEWNSGLHISGGFLNEKKRIIIWFNGILNQMALQL